MWDAGGGGDQAGRGRREGRLGSPQGPRLSRVCWKERLDIQGVSSLLALFRQLPHTRN